MARLATEVAESSQQPNRRPDLAWAKSPQAITIYCYVALAFYVTSRLWFNPRVTRQSGDEADVNQAAWFVHYAATAVRHFRLPALMTMAMNAPHGVNLMWNTSFLLPGIVVSPITIAAGPQVALVTLLFIGFAGSAASMFYVLRRWNVSIIAAALGGALYGFSPALVNSGIGHYALVLAMFPPLIIDRVLRIVTGRGRPVRNGIWLGVFVAAQFFTSEETLVVTVIATVILLAVLAISRPGEVLASLRRLAPGLGTAVALAALICARGLWVQFHGVAAKTATTVTILYNGHFTNLGTLPYAFVTPASSVVLHSSSTSHSVANYPQPAPEYLAYLGLPLIILLLVAIVYFWGNLAIRAAGVTCILLEWLGMGAKPIVPHVVTLPGFLLPWGYLQHLPVLSGMVPDRLCILADAAAAVVLAYSLDLARSGAKPFANWRNGAKIASAVAVVALLPLLPAPYSVSHVEKVPPGWQATYSTLDLTPQSRVLLAPFPWAGNSQVMLWQADTGKPSTMIGGDFISPNRVGRQARAGRAGLTITSNYINDLYRGDVNVPAPSAAQVHADMATMKPQAVMAVTSLKSPLGRYLVKLFGQPDTQIGQVLGWHVFPGEVIPTSGVY